MEKGRLDVIVMGRVDVSRTMAQDWIENGLVSLDGRILTAPGKKYDMDIPIMIHLPERQYVSRAGYKLERALADFQIEVSQAVCLDIGASTGGFTDCLLQHGAKRVYAVDTGSNQLHQKLREDPRVIMMEQTNINDVEVLPEAIVIGVVDVSFVSLTKILANVAELLNNRDRGQCCVALVKPQFEVGRAGLNKRGIVKNPKDLRLAMMNIYNYANEIGWPVHGAIQSPVLGVDGNREFLFYLRKGPDHIRQKEFQRLAEELTKKPL